MNQIANNEMQYLDQIDWAELAAQVSTMVIAKMHARLHNWAGELSMCQMFVQDAADGLAVCEILVSGDWHKAQDRLRNMDTAARDCVYDMIHQVAGADFFDLVG
jgi:hypothetical protein